VYQVNFLSVNSFCGRLLYCKEIDFNNHILRGIYNIKVTLIGDDTILLFRTVIEDVANKRSSGFKRNKCAGNGIMAVERLVVCTCFCPSLLKRYLFIYRKLLTLKKFARIICLSEKCTDGEE